MPVPSTINDLSTTAGANYPAGTESPSTIDDYLRAHAAFIAGLRDGKVSTTGNETIAGTKTFSSTIVGSVSGSAGTASSATTATNLAGGSAGTIPYQSAAGTTAQLAAGTANYILKSNGAAAPSWVAQSTIDAGSVDGKSFGTFGAAGGILYATSTTDASATSAGTSGQVLLSGGGGVPTWSAQSALSVGSATSATNSTNSTNVAVTDDTATNSTFYPVFASAATGNIAPKVSSTKFNFNPSTGVLTCTGFAGNVTGNVTGNAGTVTNGVYTVGNQTIAGVKTFTDFVYIPNATPGDNSTKAASTAFVTDAVTTVGNKQIGISQTWNDVTGSRSTGSPSAFQNTSTRPIFVSVSLFSTSASSSATLVCNGVQVDFFSTGNANALYTTLKAVIPPGATYGVTGTNISLNKWFELF